VSTEPEFAGRIGRTYRDSVPSWPPPPGGLGGPDVVLIVLDDTGFAHFGCYGSTLETPAIDSLADGGLRYTGFHTTALCSPSRACLLTGRNHHSVGMRGVSNWNTGYPHMRGGISPRAATVAEALRAHGYAMPDYPESPTTDPERDVRARYDKLKGSAVNPVLRQGNSDRRAPASVKHYARTHPHKMGAWSPGSRTNVAHMSADDFYSTERSTVVAEAGTLRIELVRADGTTTALRDPVPVLAGEVVDAAVMRVAPLATFLRAQIARAKAEGVLFSIHLKATMMKVSDPIIFGHVVRSFLPGTFERYGDVLAAAELVGRPLPAILHIDTGMARLGLDARELDCLAQAPELLSGLDLRFVMTHLVASERPEDPLNGLQRARFAAACAMLPAAPRSLANSSGIFLGAEFTSDLARAGAALYGINPVPGEKNPMRPVARLRARVIQVREIAAHVPVGYDATWRAARPSRIATVALGYADGWPFRLSGRGMAVFDGAPVPLVGRVSMDLTTYDVTDHPAIQAESWLEVIGPDLPPERIAAQAGTTPYEVLTSLGARIVRLARAA